MEIFDGIRSYDFFNTFGYCMCAVVSLFFVKSKVKTLSVYADYISAFLNKKNTKINITFRYIAAIIEGLIMAVVGASATFLNSPFGKLVGTGANYFGALFSFAILWFVMCIIFLENPLKSIDIATMGIPIYLFFVKIACFCQGCCYGIPWKHGMYNHHPEHPGYQVPVQLLEALWAILIFIFLLWYRKRAKPGTVFPTYMILYSATRFCSEFFRREEPVLWILKTYHILCLIGIVFGVIMLIIVKLHGDKISNFFDITREKIIRKMFRSTFKIKNVINSKISKLKSSC